MKQVLAEKAQRSWKTLRSWRPQVPAESYKLLFYQDKKAEHWAYYYARKLLSRPISGPIKIQTSMSPTGYFHIGNFRDTVCAFLVQRALQKLGREAHILLSFDNYDPFRQGAKTLEDSATDYSAQPQGSARYHNELICRRYIQELKQVGICPAEVDELGQSADGQPLNSWLTHYQYQRYPSGEYDTAIRQQIRDVNLLADMLGKARPENLFGVYCGQCGRSQTEILKLTTSSVSYFCRYCHSLQTTDGMRGVKPGWTLDWALRVIHEQIHCEPAGQDHCIAGSTMDRTKVIYSRYYHTYQPVILPYGLVRQFRAGSKISGSKGNGLTVSDLLKYFPPVMILWLYARRNCLSDIRFDFDKASFYAYYDEFDQFLQNLAKPRNQALYGLLTDAAPPERRLPAMRVVCSYLQANFFDTERTLAELQEAGYRDAAPFRLAERIEIARQWLATYGRHESWPIAAEISSEEAALANLQELAAVVKQAQESVDKARLSRTDYDGLYRALFGTSYGPPLGRVIGYFGFAQVETALQTFNASGQRPLREKVLQNLTNEAVENA